MKFVIQCAAFNCASWNFERIAIAELIYLSGMRLFMPGDIAMNSNGMLLLGSLFQAHKAAL